jgi:hypothetical protein
MPTASVDFSPSHPSSEKLDEVAKSLRYRTMLKREGSGYAATIPSSESVSLSGGDAVIGGRAMTVSILYVYRSGREGAEKPELVPTDLTLVNYPGCEKATI